MASFFHAGKLIFNDVLHLNLHLGNLIVVIKRILRYYIIISILYHLFHLVLIFRVNFSNALVHYFSKFVWSIILSQNLALTFRELWSLEILVVIFFLETLVVSFSFLLLHNSHCIHFSGRKSAIKITQVFYTFWFRIVRWLRAYS